MCGSDGFRIHLAVPDRGLGAELLDFSEPGRIEGLLRVGEFFAIPGGGWSKGAQNLVGYEPVEAAEEFPVEGLDDQVIDQAALVEEIGKGLGIAGFAFDEGDAASLDELQGVEQGGDAFLRERRLKLSTGGKRDEFGGVARIHPDALGLPTAGGVGGAVEGAVMNDDGHAIAGVVVVEFDEVGAGGEGVAEGCEGVFGGESRVAAMADHQRALQGEQRVSGEG